MPALFEDLCSIFEKIEETSGRLEIQQILSNYLSTLDKNNIIIAFYICTGTVYPTYENKELNIGEGILYKVIGDMTGRNIKVLKREYADCGDLGQIACKYKINKLVQVKKNFELCEIYDGLRKIGEIEGKDAIVRKKNAILKILSVMSTKEIRYFVRLLEGKLKIGLAIQTVLISIGMVFENKEDSLDILKRAYNRCASVEILIDKIYKDGIQSLECLGIVPLIPFRAMLCNPLSSFAVGFSDFICEVKYDGERIQIHKKDDNVKFYSRNGEDSTFKYPDLAMIVRAEKNDFILDGEVVAYDTSTGKILPFQVLSTRKRKDVSKIDVFICVFVFDILSINGKCLLDRTLRERRDVLKNIIREQDGIKYAESLGEMNSSMPSGDINKNINVVPDDLNGVLEEATSKTLVDKSGLQVEEKNEQKNEENTVFTAESKSENSIHKNKHEPKRKIADLKQSEIKNTKRSKLDMIEKSSTQIHIEETIEKAFNESLNQRHEGLIIKNLNSLYVPNKRSNDWLKLKKDYISMADTVDLIVMGAFYGKGKRTGVYGGFLMGCYNNERVEAICKLGTGFDEQTLGSLRDKLSVSKSVPKLYKYSDSSTPDLWIDPEYVFEVNAASISNSPLYTTGLSLRFPRFIKIREDKRIEDATTLSYIKLMTRKESYE